MSSNSVIGPILSSLSGIFVDKGISVVTDLVKDVTEEGASQIKDFIQDKTGIDLSDEDQVLSMDEDQALLINNTVQNYDVQLQALKNKYMEIVVEDAMDAREMNLELAKLGPKGMLTFQNVLALLLIVFYMSISYILLLVPMSPEGVEFGKDIFMFSSGTIAATVAGFYFGNKA